MRFGISNLVPVTGSLDEWRRFNDRAEAAGFDHVAVGDVQTRLMELTVSLSLLASETSTLRFGPMISNPVTRHPGVAANAFASLQRISGGRAWFGVSTGNSAVRNLGATPATLETLEDYIRAFRGLVAEGRASYRGRDSVLPWAPSVVPGGVPIYVAGNGPKALRLAGALGDGVIVGGGVTPEVIEHSLSNIADGAKQAGRRFEDLDIWFQIHVVVGEPDGEVLDDIKDVLAGAGARNFRHTFEGKGVPKALEAPIRRLEEEYDYSQHCVVGQNGALLDKYDLLEFFTDLWLVAGSPADIVRRLKDIGASGVDNVHAPGFVPDPFGLIDTMRDEIMPQV